MQTCAALTRDGLPCQRVGFHPLCGLKSASALERQLYCKQHKLSLQYVDKPRRFSRVDKQRREREQFHHDVMRFAGPLVATGGARKRYENFTAALRSRRHVKSGPGRLALHIHFQMGASPQKNFLGSCQPNEKWRVSLAEFPGDVFPRLRAIFRQPECSGCADYDAMSLAVAVQQYVNVKYPTANARVVLSREPLQQ